MKDGSYVALTKTACPFCAKQENGDLVLSLKLQDISEVHGKVVEWKPCAECKEAIDQGAIMFIVVDKNKSDMETGLSGLYHTGNVFGLRQHAVERILSDVPNLLKDVLEKRFCVIHYEDAIMMGFEVKYTP